MTPTPRLFSELLDDENPLLQASEKPVAPLRYPTVGLQMRAVGGHRSLASGAVGLVMPWMGSGRRPVSTHTCRVCTENRNVGENRAGSVPSSSRVSSPTINSRASLCSSKQGHGARGELPGKPLWSLLPAPLASLLPPFCPFLKERVNLPRQEGPRKGHYHCFFCEKNSSRSIKHVHFDYHCPKGGGQR